MSALRVGYVRGRSLRGLQAPRWPGSGGRSSNAKTRLGQTRQHSNRTTEAGSDREGRSWARRGLALAGELVVAACAVHCFMEFVAEPYTVAGPSMQPTIEDKSVLLVNKMLERGSALRLGEIVVAQSPSQPGRMVVKRVVGLPGDYIEVRPPPWDVHNTLGIETRLEVVPEGHVWLEGDNKNNSTDSRSYGAVPQALVEGVVVLRLWPFGQLLVG